MALNSTACSPAGLLAAFQVPLQEGQTEAPESMETADKEMNRISLNGYYGADILREMRKVRKKWEKLHGAKAPSKVVTATENSMEFPKGKVFFKKE